MSINQDISSLYEKTNSLSNAIEELSKNMQGMVTSMFSTAFKYQSQSEVMQSFVTALCIDTQDVWGMNRIRFFTPVLHDPSKTTIDQLPWASPISNMGGFDDSGCSWIPPAGSTVCIIFENGSRNSPYYMGTTWSRTRGVASNVSDGTSTYSRDFGVPIPEFERVYEGHRTGYLVGPNDGSQCFPPWNTESYNKFDLDSLNDISLNPDDIKRSTIPNIYGYKTNEKHGWKFVDGDPLCNRKWKRAEFTSSCGHYMVFKDDPFHYAGQWVNPICVGGDKDGDVNCIRGVGGVNSSQDLTRLFGLSDLSPDQVFADQQADITQSNLDQLLANNAELEPENYGTTFEEIFCFGDQTNPTIIGGHPNTPIGTKYYDNQIGRNPFFKNQNECRPYSGPGTPQNNKVELGQTGFQFGSISGHVMFADDSVEEPRGETGWERSLLPFDYGCNDLFLGRMGFISSTGHSILMNDYESQTGVRGKLNGITLRTALGTTFFLGDDTTGNSDDTAGRLAGDRRGLFARTTSNHSLIMSDYLNDNPPSEARKALGDDAIKNNASGAYVALRTGYGLGLVMEDSNSQKETQNQILKLIAPQKTSAEGAHILAMQESVDGGYVLLRAGGKYIQVSTQESYEIVGEIPDDENQTGSPTSNKVVIVGNDSIMQAHGNVMTLGKQVVFIAKDKIVLLAGNDCKNDDDEEVPCIAPVLVYHEGAIKISDNLIGSCTKNSQIANIASFKPFYDAKLPDSTTTTPVPIV